MRNRKVYLPTPVFHYKQWTIKYEPPTTRNSWGEVDWDKRIIRIHPKQSAEDLLATLFHEFTHVAELDREQAAIVAEYLFTTALEIERESNDEA